MIAGKITNAWTRGPMLVMLMTSALAAGCAGSKYVKAGVTEQQSKRDHAECLQAGFGAASIQPYPSIDRDAVDRCMAERGYMIRQ